MEEMVKKPKEIVENGGGGGDEVDSIEMPPSAGIADQMATICTSSGSTLNELMMSSSSTDSCGGSSSDEVLVEEGKDLLTPISRSRTRTLSSSKAAEHDVITTETGRKVYTKGRPPWYDRAGKRLKKSYLIGICGGSASGKTTVAKKIIEKLEMPWVTVLSMDSFYKVLNEEQHQLAAKHEYNFDHPDAFDFDLLYETLLRLRDGKSVEVPVYDFTTHRRAKNPKLMYGADILIFEGILSFHKPAIADLMDMKVFVDTDSDTRLARRLERDIAERGRDVGGVLEQYIKFVKPAFDSFIAPAMKIADIIVPRGGENLVAIDLIVRQIKNQLTERGYYATTNGGGGGGQGQQQNRQCSPPNAPPIKLPPSLHIFSEPNRVHKQLIGRNARSEGLPIMQKLIEEAIGYFSTSPSKQSNKSMPALNQKVQRHKNGLQNSQIKQQKSPKKQQQNGRPICGVTIMRAGKSLETSLRSVIGDCKMGKILIQTNERTQEPELYYLRLPKNISQYKILLMDITVATGAAAMMAIRILLDHDVREEDIILMSLWMAEAGVHSLAYAFPRVRLLTTAVQDDEFFNNCSWRESKEEEIFDEFLCSGNEVVELATTDDEEEVAMANNNGNGKTDKKNDHQQQQFNNKMQQMCA